MKYTIIISLLFVVLNAQSQSSLNELVEQGIEYHDAGNYEDAINVYKEALVLDPKSLLVHYEISLSYFKMNNCEKAIEHSKVVVKANKDHLIPAYLVQGSCLDLLGKTRQSIKLFEKGIKKLGDDYLLHYNLGLNYFKLKDYKKTEIYAINAIKANANHSSSHFLLGYANYFQNKTVESLLPVYYFLMLEPETKRSQEGYALLKDVFGGNVTEDPDKPNTINISIPSSGLDSEFAAAEMLIPLLESSKLREDNKDKTEDEMFIENTTSVFKVLGESKNEARSFYSEFYVPFFYNLATSEHINAFCNYIIQNSSKDAQSWIAENNTKLNAFVEWVNSN